MIKKCSIIIRTKNEERWIVPCLEAVYNQTYKNIEVVIVDNESTDKTIKKAKKFPGIKYVSIKVYLPGDSLNVGIRASSGSYIVCLSAHCIPVNEYWLENLVNTLEEDKSYAGVYGRQEPMSFTPPSDKRDMLLVFGLDKKVQSKDSFFHNANSILHRSLWDKAPFDNEITNIEDRVWGQQMLNLGYKLAYEPEASVYHYHGIHQNGDVERCNNVVRIIQDMQSINSNNKYIDAENLDIVAIIPIKDKDWLIGDKLQMSYTIESALQSNYIDRVLVTTKNRDTVKLAKSLGAKYSFLRTDNLTMDYIGLDLVLKDAVAHLEESGIYPDLVISLEETFPFRREGLIDEMIEHLLNKGLDTVIAAKIESGSIWQESEKEKGVFERLDSGDMPRLYKEKSYIGLKGLCCVTYTEFVRQEITVGNKVGLFEVKSPLASFEVRSDNDRKVALQLLEENVDL
jgi:glycosyltransferase involved in cell wall biosynthesis